MKIWHKTLLPPLVALIGLGAIGYALVTISATKSAMHETFARQTKVLAALGVQRLALAKRHNEAQLLVFGSAKAEKDEREAELAKFSNALARFTEFLREDLAGVSLTDNEEALLKEIETAVTGYTGEIKGAVEMGAIDAALGVDGVTKANRLQNQAADAMQALLASIEARSREVETAAIGAMESQIRIAIIAAGVTLVLLVLLSVLMARQIVRPLTELATVARRVAAGDLDSAIHADRRDETGEVLRAFADVKNRLQQFESAQLSLAAAHEAGDTDHRIDASLLPGAYGTLAAKVNELIDSQLALQQQFIAVMNDYARGELATQMPQLPGKKAQITDAAFGVQRSLAAISAEIDQLVSAASVGDFAARGNATRYEAKFADMVTGLNALMATCESGLADANRVFASLAQGDLCARIEADYRGMFGQMKDNANQSMDSLTELIGRIREASESVGTASAEIARGNTDLSSRTESQAASLEQTTASIEELTGTVAQNAQSAQQAATLAANASAIATRGGSTVREVVGTMGSIAAASKRVQDIISVIDGIAFQTNILALNAAVEAARAGEQGKGFAVVASEVRNLAQRSAAAAKEIKSLITESAGRIDSGTSLVNAAGAQMEEIVGAVKQVTDIIAEIAAASAEQHQGIEQVNRAIAAMDTTTQQNAALVEQASAAAEAMRFQAHALAAAVGEFNAPTSANARTTERMAA